MRILVVTPDAFGAHGGIAQYNRDLLLALVAINEVDEVVAIPRHFHFPIDELPGKLRFHIKGAKGKFHFIAEALAASKGRFDLLICGHVNLLPVAALLRRKVDAPLVLLAYGIDVWHQHRSLLVRSLIQKIDKVWSISEITREKMVNWSGLARTKFEILPNAIDLARYGPGPKLPRMIEQYRLAGRKVIMMMGRLSASERYKGVDEVLEVIPRLSLTEPRLVFLVAGDGDDRPRLEKKAAALGIADRVVFTGFVPEEDKIAHYRLADAFVMPGHGEGFGFVFLEAMACGVPVVASKLDGSQEAVRHGLLGRLVNPSNANELEANILGALSDRRCVPEGLGYFAVPEFQRRVAEAVSRSRAIK